MYFNTPLDSINSIIYFDLYDSYPADSQELKFEKENIKFDSLSIQFTTLDPISSEQYISMTSKDISDVKSIFFNLGKWEINTNNTDKISLNDIGCKFSWTTDDSDKISFSITNFQDEAIHSIQLVKDNSRFELINIPNRYEDNNSSEYN